MPVQSGDNGGGFAFPQTPDEVQANINELLAETERERNAITAFAIKKGIQKPVDILLEEILTLAKGLKGAPAFHIGQEIIVGTAGGGEEEAIQRAIVAKLIADIAYLGQLITFATVGSGGVAMRLLMRDP